MRIRIIQSLLVLMKTQQAAPGKIENIIGKNIFHGPLEPWSGFVKTRVVTEFTFVPTVFSRAVMVVMMMKRGEEKSLTFYGRYLTK